MSNWYDSFSNFDVSKVASESTGMDYFLTDTIEADERFHDMRQATVSEELPDQMKVASLDNLSGFVRVANTNTLVRKSDQDLWELKEGEDGEFLIERLFDETGSPLKV